MSIVTNTNQSAPANTGTGADALPELSKEQKILEEVLPQIKDLAQRVGGMDKLRELVATLANATE